MSAREAHGEGVVRDPEEPRAILKGVMRSGNFSAGRPERDDALQ